MKELDKRKKESLIFFCGEGVAIYGEICYNKNDNNPIADNNKQGE